LKKTSIKDIANSLNVSPTLVSLVLNGKGDDNGISQITQAKVIEKAKELNYSPNQAARTLRIGKTETIGLIVSDIANPFYAQIAGRVERKASKAGYNLIVCSTYEDTIKENDLIRMLISRNVDGMIISSSAVNCSEIFKLKKAKFPFVLIDRKLPIQDINIVASDNKSGSYMAVNHLLEKGYRSIAIFLITPTHISSVTERKEGYIQALEDADMNIDDQLIFEIRFDHIMEDSETAIKSILSKNPGLEAVFSSNNSITTACLKIFSGLKIKVPNDMALFSFDDVDWFEFSEPKISTVAQSVDEIGDQAVDILLEDIKSNGEMEKKQVFLMPKLIIREST